MYNLRKSNSFIVNRFSPEFEFKHTQYNRGDIEDKIIREFGSNKWIVTTDASLTPYSEYSEIHPHQDNHLKGQDGINQINKLLRMLNADFNATQTTKTGLHIHHDIIDLTPKQISNIFTWYYNYEDIINLVIPYQRRESIVNVHHLQYSMVADIQKYARRFENDRESFMAAVRRGGSVSLRLSGSYDTLEFRRAIFSVDSEKVSPWITFTQNVVKFFKKPRSKSGNQKFLKIHRRHNIDKRLSTQSLDKEQYIKDNFGIQLALKYNGVLKAFRECFEFKAGNRSQLRAFENRALKLARQNRDKKMLILEGLSDYIDNLYTK
jgi:hypothetical protein